MQHAQSTLQLTMSVWLQGLASARRQGAVHHSMSVFEALSGRRACPDGIIGGAWCRCAARGAERRPFGGMGSLHLLRPLAEPHHRSAGALSHPIGSLTGPQKRTSCENPLPSPVQARSGSRALGSSSRSLGGGQHCPQGGREHAFGPGGSGRAAGAPAAAGERQQRAGHLQQHRCCQPGPTGRPLRRGGSGRSPGRVSARQPAEEGRQDTEQPLDAGGCRVSCLTSAAAAAPACALLSTAARRRRVLPASLSAGTPACRPCRRPPRQRRRWRTPRRRLRPCRRRRCGRCTSARSGSASRGRWALHCCAAADTWLPVHGGT